MGFNGYEDELEYLEKMIDSGNKDWDKAIYDLDLNIHRDSLRKAWDTTKFSGYSVLKYFKNKQEKNLSVDEIERLEELKDKVYKEKCKLQDANREKRKYLREESRTETMLEYLRECINDLEHISFKKCDYTYGTNIEATLLVSDLHNGAKVDNIYNYYDEDVLIDRLEQLKDKTVALCKKNQVDLLNIELLGDFITGRIHGSTISQANDDLVSQIVNISEILANFINEIAKEVPNVRVYSVFGNHDRSTKNKSDGAVRENFGRLVPEFIKLRLRHIKVIDSKYEDHLTYKLRDGRLIVNTHGQYDNLANARNHFVNLLKQDVFEIHMAHYHEYKESDGVVVNGSIMGADDYAISLRKNSKATQILRIYGEDTCCYKLELD